MATLNNAYQMEKVHIMYVPPSSIMQVGLTTILTRV